MNRIGANSNIDGERWPAVCKIRVKGSKRRLLDLDECTHHLLPFILTTVSTQASLTLGSHVYDPQRHSGKGCDIVQMDRR